MTLNNRIKLIQDNQEHFIVEMKETQKQQKQVEYIKAELDGLLWAELMENKNIFDDEVKAVVIDVVMNNTDVLLYNKDYTRQYLNKRYYTIARQVEQIQKKTAPKNQDDYKKQIALDKWDLQRQKELLKIKQLKQKIAQNEQKCNTKQPRKQIYAKRSGGEVAKVLIYIMLAPIAIFGLIIYGFISAAAKTK